MNTELVGVRRGQPNSSNDCDAVYVVLKTADGLREDAAPVLNGDLGKAMLVALLRASDHDVPADPQWSIERFSVSLDVSPGAYELFAPVEYKLRNDQCMSAAVRIRANGNRLLSASWSGNCLDQLIAMGNVLLQVVQQYPQELTQ